MSGLAARFLTGIGSIARRRRAREVQVIITPAVIVKVVTAVQFTVVALWPETAKTTMSDMVARTRSGGLVLGVATAEQQRNRSGSKKRILYPL